MKSKNVIPVTSQQQQAIADARMQWQKGLKYDAAITIAHHFKLNSLEEAKQYCMVNFGITLPPLP